ncbi:MAG: TonB family protein, partial [Gemmatimonadota bacterium]|nr:TonB family protein [Gemmatimonadota bacterium]
WTEGEILDAPVMMSQDRGPAVVGLGRGVIVMPSWIADLEEDVLRLVFLHEREHQLAGDNRLFSLGLMAVAAMPWNPMAWWQLRRLRLAIEFDCDRRVMARGVEPRDYAEALLAVGTRLTSAPLAAFAFAERKPAVERRLRRMTEPLRHLRGPRAMLAAGLGALALMVACGSPLPMNAPATAEPDAAVIVDAEVDEAPPKVAPPEGQQPQFIPYDVPPAMQNRSEMMDAIEAAYPADARAENLGGRTELWLYIDDTGEVANMEVKTSSGDRRFDDAAMKVISQAEFSPATNQGVVTGVWVSQWVTFEDDGVEMRQADRPKGPPGTGPAPLYVIDGEVLEPGQRVRLDRDAIESVEVVKGETAIETYGERARDGVVVIKVKDGYDVRAADSDAPAGVQPDGKIVFPPTEGQNTAGVVVRRSGQAVGISDKPPTDGQGVVGVVRRSPEQPIADVAPPGQGAAGVLQRSGQQADVTDATPPSGQNAVGVIPRDGKTGFGMQATGRSESPLIVIDGEIQDESATLADVGAFDIDHVEILKGEAAREAYGDRGRDGVIQITTKGAADSRGDAVDARAVAADTVEIADVAVDTAPVDAAPVDAVAVDVVDSEADATGIAAALDVRPLIVVDGVVQDPSIEMSDLEALDIDSVEVIKGEAAERLYGIRGRNGVVSIKTRGGGDG